MSSCLPLFLPPSMSQVATALSYPSDILPWNWRAQKRASPTRRPIVLPPISNLNFKYQSPQHLQQMESNSPCSSISSSRPPSPIPTVPVPLMSTTQWYGADTPASAVAEKTAEMICYLWFSSNRELARGSNTTRSRSRSRYSPTFARVDAAAAALQFAASERFVYYIRKVLETTQVSQSVIVLSLHYIYRLRQQNNMTAAQEGSEFRVAVIALMLANKFVDDNTYTNKTWSEVAGIELDELNRMEREFLMGIDSRLYVNKATYDSWLQLLKGLVLAKEREQSYMQPSQRISTIKRNPALSRVPGYSLPPPGIPVLRPRSTSPTSSRHAFTFNVPHPYHSQFDHSMEYESVGPQAGSKRSAVSAFDADRVQAYSRPYKRSILLNTDVSNVQGPRSANPSFASSSSSHTPSSDAFSKLSLSHTSNLLAPSNRPSPYLSPVQNPPPDSQILARAYHADPQMMNSQPQNLYFYALSGSPQDATAYEPIHRKAKLRHARRQTPVMHHPVPANSTPLVIQSANPSPRHNMTSLMNPRPNYGLRQEHFLKPIPPTVVSHTTTLPRIVQPSDAMPTEAETAVPAANFANAGPPGVHWIATTPSGGGPSGWHRTRTQ